MKIGIILHPYGESQPGGLPRVIYGWTEALLAEDKDNEYIIYLKNKPAAALTLPGKNRKSEILGEGILWMTKLRKKEQADVYIFNTPVLPLFFKPKKSILIVYDFPYKYLPPRDFTDRVRRVFMGWYHGHSMRKASAIIAVSESTKEDIIKFFNIPPEKIRVIYHGFKKICAVPEKAFPVPGKYFFFAGTLKERKNVLNIIKAFELFQSSFSDKGLSLLIGGKNEGTYFELLKKYIETHNLKNVVFAGHLKDEELSYVYRRALALVFPSIVEGTGNPILEAMDCGIPVITSDIFGPAELGEDAAILIDPYNVEEMAEAMRRISSDAALRNELVAKGQMQMKKFDWQKAAKETLELINTIK